MSKRPNRAGHARNSIVKGQRSRLGLTQLVWSYLVIIVDVELASKPREGGRPSLTSSSASRSTFPHSPIPVLHDW